MPARWPKACALVLAAFALLWTLPLRAQGVAVQSGEHDGFTRLVVALGPTRDWTMGGEGFQRRLTGLPDLPDLDLSAVFDKIPRTRLRDLRQEGRALVLDLACACEVTLTRYRDSYLIIDISDGPAAIVQNPAQAARGLRPDLFAPVTSQVTAQIDPRYFGQTQTAAPRGDLAELADAAAALLAEQIARGAASGLLQPIEGLPLTFGDPQSSTTPTPASPQLPPVIEDPASPDLPIRARTILDANPPEGSVWARLGQTDHCPPERDFDLAIWAGAPEPFTTNLAAIAQRVTDARDRIVPQAASDLARLYLAYGLGAEALFWMDMAAETRPDLRALALYFEGHDGPHFTPPLDYEDCKGAALLWRILDDPDLPILLSQGQLSAIMQAHGQLPQTLRDQVTLDLARVLLARGHEAQARDLRDAALRGNRLTEDDQFLLDLDVGLTPVTDPAQLGDHLATMIGVNPVEAAERAARALELARTGGQAPDRDMQELGAALLRETGSGPESALWREMVLAHAASGALAQAEAMIRAAPNPNEAAFQDTLDELFRARAAAGDLTALIYFESALGPFWESRPQNRAIHAAVGQALAPLGLRPWPDAIGVRAIGVSVPAATRTEASVASPPPPSLVTQSQELSQLLADTARMRAEIGALLAEENVAR